MSSSGDADSKVITASCTLLAAGQVCDGTSPSTPASITLHTSSQKIVIPVATVCASADKQSSLPPVTVSVVTPPCKPGLVDGPMFTRSSDTVNTTASSMATGSRHVEGAAADDTSQRRAPQKTGSSNPVTRRVRFQAKPNISKNARTRSVN